MLRWLATSKLRIDSTVSPKNSIRTGSYQSGAKMSRMPPRTRELAGQRHRAGIVKSAFGQPADERLDIDFVADLEAPRVVGQARRARAPVAAGFECW